MTCRCAGCGHREERSAHAPSARRRNIARGSSDRGATFRKGPVRGPEAGEGVDHRLSPSSSRSRGDERRIGSSLPSGSYPSNFHNPNRLGSRLAVCSVESTVVFCGGRAQSRATAPALPPQIMMASGAEPARPVDIQITAHGPQRHVPPLPVTLASYRIRSVPEARRT